MAKNSKVKKVKIDKVNIKIGDQEIPLTLDQAKELQQLLNDTFGLDKVCGPVYPTDIDRRPVRPYRFPYDPYWGVTYTSNTATFSLNANMVS